MALFRKALTGVLIAAGVLVVAMQCLPFVVIPIHVYQTRQERHRLLHETDHRELLAASRTLLQECAGQRISDPAHDPRVPRIIRELGPSYILIFEDRLHVELHGGFDHYGFDAYAEGVDPGKNWGKLIDGLYYHSE